jgi:rhodanese-related sulfurtransferase
MKRGLSAFLLLATAACAPLGSGEPGIAPLAADQKGAVRTVTPAELQGRLGSVRLIDVRTDAEVAEGVIPGAEHVALSGFDPAVLDLSGEKPIVLYCRSGRRSAIAAQRLAAHTGEPALHLEGGVLGWQDAGGEIIDPE